MINHESKIPVKVLNSPELKNVKKQILVGPNDGFDGFLREFIISEGGFTPLHKHDWYHLNYVISGEGILIFNGEEHLLTRGSVAYVPPMTEHQFRNTGKGELKFLCLVPEKGDSY